MSIAEPREPQVPHFKQLIACGGGELIRLRVGSATEWALVGATSQGWLPIFVLAKTPVVENAITDAFGSRSSRFGSDVLTYGTGNPLIPDYSGPCDLETGPLFNQHGTVWLGDNDL